MSDLRENVFFYIDFPIHKYRSCNSPNSPTSPQYPGQAILVKPFPTCTGSQDDGSMLKTNTLK